MTAAHDGRRPAVPAPARHQLPRRITVGIVTLNAAAVLERALASVLRHKSAALELVVMDGGSTDGTLEILRRHGSAIDTWRCEPDAGIYDAMNKVLRAATGDWLLFLGADDELLLRAEDLLSDMDEPETVYYGDVVLSDSGLRSGGRFSAYRLMQENICHQAILYPRTVYKNKLYDTRCGVLADHKYNLQLWGSRTPFSHIDRVVSRYHEGGASALGDPGFEATKLAVIRTSLGWPMYLIKRARSAAVRLLKPRHGTA